MLGLGTAASWAGIPLGSLLGGWLVDATTIRVALVSFAAVYLLAALLPFTGASWRGLDRPPATEPAAVPAPTPT